MLRIIQNRSSASAQSYYSKADYYSEGQELAGTWGGLGAERLGLSDLVQQADFKALCENRIPGTNDRLTPRTNDDRTVGYDFNFHVPKGVSIAYMLTQDDSILQAFRDSVRETMQELEVDTKTRIRRQKRDSERTTGNLTWAEFIHFTARPVEGIPDPHLHAHCFVFNQTFDQEENRWKAAQFRDIKRDAPYFEAAFHARLGKRLEELGYPIARQGKQWDLAGLPKTLTQKFSRRTQQVERHAADKGIHNDQEKSQLGAKTREKKDSELSLPELRQLWQARLTSEEQQALAQVAAKNQPAKQRDQTTPEQALNHAIEHCFERNSVVPKRDLLAQALRHGVGQITVEQAHQQLGQEAIYIRPLSGRDLATTPQVLAEERAMLDFARGGIGQSNALNSTWKVKQEWLNTEQQAAVQHVLQSPDRVMLIQGMAGTGKTSLMQEAVAGMEANGKRVFAFAPSAEASRNVLRKEGFADATTVAELLANPKLQQQAQGQVWWVDEAGLLGTRQLKQVFDLAERFDARIILSGDWRQHGAVERGAAMRLLQQEAGLKPAIVNTIQRQRGMYREAVAQLAQGRAESGLEILDELGWIQELEGEAREKKIAQEFAESVRAEHQAPLVVSPTHAEGDRITAAIRQELKRCHLLPEEDRTFSRLVPLNLTQAERADPARYEPGDVIVFQQNAPGHRKGERFLVEDQPPAELLQHAARFQVYQRKDLHLAVGDPVRFTSNATTKDGQHRLNNGAIHQIAGFTKEGDIRLENNWIVSRDHGFLAPGYVVTSHASQGKTYNKVLIAESSQSLPAASQEQLYVSVSRGRHQAIIFTDDKAALKEATSRSRTRIAASELVRQQIRQQSLQQTVELQNHSRDVKTIEREAYEYR